MKNATGKGYFQPGISGNPSGKPKQAAELTKSLLSAFSAIVDTEDGPRPLYDQVNSNVMQAVITGWLEFPDGHKLKLTAEQYRSWIEWIYDRLAGKPTIPLDTSGLVIQWDNIGAAQPEDTAAAAGNASASADDGGGLVARGGGGGDG